MREHMGLYRGKRICNGKWMEGYLLRLADDTCLICQAGYRINRYKVDPDSICECTGLKDKNGRLIFEGDSVQFFAPNYVFDPTPIEGCIKWDEKEARFVLRGGICNCTFRLTDVWEIEIIDKPRNLERW